MRICTSTQALSTLLRCRASPEIAPYPFTTLMPNLGVLAASNQKAEPEEDFSGPDFLPSSNSSNMSRASAPILADLPGLIQGAHAGRGLGRMFLRHLRRTRGLLHVVDASAGICPADRHIPVSFADRPAAPAGQQI